VQWINPQKSETVPGTWAKNEIDTRADVIVAGKNFFMLSHTGQCCNVYGFTRERDAINNIPIATVAMAWTDPRTGLEWILLIHEALYVGTQLDHSLINPNQIHPTRYV
jgi:hypothetical protein